MAQVSVILPVYNDENYIIMSIQSILDQTYRDFELIVVDDASTDHTLDRIRLFNDERIRLIELKENKGQSHAKNVGLDAARGQWVAFIDSDDEWHEKFLEILIAIAKAHPNAFVACDILVCFSNKNKNLIPWKKYRKQTSLKPGENIFLGTYEFVKMGLDAVPICPLSFLRKHEIRFYEKWKGSEWLRFELSLFRFGLYFVLWNEALYYYRIRPRSSSSKYSSILNELENIRLLQASSWLDRPTRVFLQEKYLRTKPRLLTTALRERKWITALRTTLGSPSSVLYLILKVPSLILEILRGRQIR